MAPFQYSVKAHPTKYRNTVFRSRLEARYAAYFDLCGFIWQYEPIDLDGWTPDFHVEVPCGHSECSGSHDFWIEVKPYSDSSEFDGHACLRFNKPYEFHCIGLGINPRVETETEFSHGAGGGVYCLSDWVRREQREIPALWEEAGNRTRYRP